MTSPSPLRVPSLECPCLEAHRKPLFRYDAPPPGETPFDCGGQLYSRAFEQCSVCGHAFAVHALDLAGLYSGGYVDSSYGSTEQMRRTFDRIMGLPPEASDNAGRTARIDDFMRRVRPGLMKDTSGRCLLDIGAGLGVFPWRMTQGGWSCVAVDPDPRAAARLERELGLRAVCGDYLMLDRERLGHFDLVTFNKVLEHVKEPVAMLSVARDNVAVDGHVYIELPDIAAADEGATREEFFLEHFHVFSPASLEMLLRRSGFSLIELGRLREPSGKFTLYAFARTA